MHLVHGATRAGDDVIDLLGGDHQRRCEAEDVALGHATGDQPFLECRRRNARADLECGIERLAL